MEDILIKSLNKKINLEEILERGKIIENTLSVYAKKEKVEDINILKNKLLNEGYKIEYDGKYRTILSKYDEKIILIPETKEAIYYKSNIPASYIEYKGLIYMVKRDPFTGKYIFDYIGDKKIINRLKRFDLDKRKKVVKNGIKVEYSCPFNCGLCNRHQNQTALLNLVVTNRCNFDCWYCFFYGDIKKYIYELTPEKAVELVKRAEDIAKFKIKAVQLTGGEPTILSLDNIVEKVDNKKDIENLDFKEDPLVKMVKELRRAGIDHIQLNSYFPILKILYYLGCKYGNHELGIELCSKYIKELRNNGLNTIYLSFDGFRYKENPKTHYIAPLLFEASRNANFNSIVLVPVIYSENLKILPWLVLFGLRHIDIVRSINIQPLSFTTLDIGQKDVFKLRATISDVIKEINKIGLSLDDWVSIPAGQKVANAISRITGREEYWLQNNPLCGAATFIFPKEIKTYGFSLLEERLDNNSLKEILKNYRFKKLGDVVDLDKFLEYFEKIDKSRYPKLAAIKNIFSLFRSIKDKDIRTKVFNFLISKDYDSLGKIMHSSLFIGIMHFMDLWNYDINRVNKCCIHYIVGNRIIPFCSFNIMHSIYKSDMERYGIQKGSKEFYEKENKLRKIRELYIEAQKFLIKESKNESPYKKIYRETYTI